jgi:hypothetical protein
VPPVAAAAGLLSAWYRARYSEEYRSELHDLAAARSGRRQQLGYASRLLLRAAEDVGAGPAPGEGLPLTGIARGARWAASALTALGIRDLAAALAAVLIVVVGLCWVVRDEDRSRRLAQIIGSWRCTRPRSAGPPVEKAPRHPGAPAAAASGPPVVPGGGPARVTMRKISFRPTSRRSSHPQLDAEWPTGYLARAPGRGVSPGICAGGKGFSARTTPSRRIDQPPLWLPGT